MTAKALTPKQALMVLNALPHIGPIVTNRLLQHLGGDPAAIFGATVKQLEQVRGVGPKITDTITHWEDHFDLAREEERMVSSEVAFVPAGETGYPPLLREIADPPIGLYRKGTYDFALPCVAIVGSRRTTLYGQSVAQRLGAELARLGFCIASGLARGIDTAAHQGALSVGGKTAAVLGNGLDIVYPPENLALYRQIQETGAIVSEFPLARPADRQSFAMRNRIVAGMSAALIVVESDVNGGSMITAKFAADQNRLVFAVPGRIDQASSAGCHQLIRDGAILLTHVDDVLSELNYLNGLRPSAIMENASRASFATSSGAAPVVELSPEEQAVMDCFKGGAILTIDGLAEILDGNVAALSVALMKLELKRCVAKRADGAFEARNYLTAKNA